MPKITTCKDCEERHPACHDTCEKYREQKQKFQQEKEFIAHAKEKENVYYDYKRKKNKKYKREI